MHTPISYLGFCALGGLTNPNTCTRNIYLGKYYMYTVYYYRRPTQ